MKISRIIIDEGYDDNGVHISTEYHCVEDNVVDSIRDILEEYCSKKSNTFIKEESELYLRT